MANSATATQPGSFQPENLKPIYPAYQAGNALALPACPGCAEPLRTALAQQCFFCGADWHATSAAFLSGVLETRRPWWRQFVRLLAATVAAQLGSLAILILLFQQPVVFLAALIIGVPLSIWLEDRVNVGRNREHLSPAARLAAAGSKLLALSCGIAAAAVPNRLAPLAIGGLMGVAIAAWLVAAARPEFPKAPVRVLLFVAALLAFCQALGIGEAIVACLLATLTLIEFGRMMMALDRWERGSRSVN